MSFYDDRLSTSWDVVMNVIVPRVDLLFICDERRQTPRAN